MDVASGFLTQPMTYIALVFGLFIGSFLNVCILRIPDKTFFKNARSVCPQCLKQIPFYHNIPVLSWLILRGRAQCCGAKISLMYPVVEALTGILFVIVYWHFPFVRTTPLGIEWEAAEFIRCMHLLIFTSTMVVVSVIDIRLQIIPDVISLSMIPLSVFWVLIHPQLDWFSSVLGILLGGGILWGVAWLYYVVRHEYGLGFGDVKLLAGIGGWLGFQAVLPTLFIGCILGALIGVVLLLISKDKSLKTRIPFGPFLAFGAWIYMLMGPDIMALFVLGNVS